MAVKPSRKKLPRSLKPLLWSLRWKDLNTREDKEDIIMAIINEGTFDQWRWLIKTYGRKTIRRVLAKRLQSEFHPESRNLAKLVFTISRFHHARKRSH